MAMTGSAAVACGVTHTLSSAILIIELTGNFSLLFPTMVCLLHSPPVGTPCSISSPGQVQQLGVDSSVAVLVLV